MAGHLEPRRLLPLNVPPAGHILGIYARTDVERGVHKAPANEVIRGILGFERDSSGFERIVNKREQDILNPSPTNINVLRDFRADNRGLRVWGARCLTSDTPWKYVPVRRLFIFLEESIDEGTQWAVFEPNDEELWATLRQSVSDFLTRVWRDGALLGATPEEAFFVRCDRTTMTQDDLDNGRLILLIGVAAVKPAEFVIIRIGQKASGAEIEEL
ncbi:MAG: phage tail sheath subtilisin-like domain-containing protein [Verrucomicrobia bacterium]|nr:phage tail sheath subtilisin-like domain-containing protein [Verrucomicrobiota bacterium]